MQGSRLAGVQQQQLPAVERTWAGMECTVSACSMACSACANHVQDMFIEPEHAEHAINYKMAMFCTSIFPLQFCMFRHVQHVQHVQTMFKPCLSHVHGMFMHAQFVGTC